MNKDSYKKALDAIDYLMNFCEEADVRGYDPYHLDDLFQEISTMEKPNG
jgi:hypothetical protein